VTLARVRTWIQKLPPYELDLPLLIVDSVAYTPRMALDEVQRGTATGMKLQSLIESGRFGTPIGQETALAILRLKQRLSRYPPEKPIVATLGTPQLPGKVYTAQELIEEIQRQTPRGIQWIQAELEQMKRVIAMARR